jgi:hypothetical protein
LELYLKKIKWYFKLEAKYQVWNGTRTYFWLDWWSSKMPKAGCSNYRGLLAFQKPSSVIM